MSRQQLRRDALAGADIAIREAAIADLSRFRNPDDIDLLLDLFRDVDVIQDLAQECVEQEFGRAVVPKLIERLPGCDEDCLCLIEALDHVGDATALEPLAAKLDDGDQTTAEWAADAIAAIAQREREVERAIALLENRSHPNRFVREHFRLVLADLRGD